MMTDMNTAWLHMVGEITTYGDQINPRDVATMELLGHQLVVNMEHCVLTVKERALGYRFMAAEAAWLLDGDNRVETIAPYSKTISGFSDNGVTFFGAYGPRLQAQLMSVVDALGEDQATRRAVANIWRENPRKTKDYPCHLSCQFLIRDRRLHCFVTMRSSDAWLGVPYDVFNFSMWSAYVLLCLHDDSVSLGNLYNTAASRHLYATNILAAEACLESTGEAFAYEPFDPREFGNCERLIEHLWQVARQQPRRHAWLKELP